MSGRGILCVSMRIDVICGGLSSPCTDHGAYGTYKCICESLTSVHVYDVRSDAPDKKRLETIGIVLA